MSKRARILSACLIVGVMLIGVVVAVAFSGTVSDVIATMLVSIPVVVAISLVFLEVGLSEDRERARERERRGDRG